MRLAAARDIPGALAIQTDIAGAEQVDAMVRVAVDAFGRLDVQVNNAGIGHARPFLDTPLEEWERVLRVNLTGPFLCAQAAERVMAAQGGGADVGRMALRQSVQEAR
ncbi:MAG: SDR family NAD(P)-dependent oxidoreductase [Bryobacteraceae bacterium]